MGRIRCADSWVYVQMRVQVKAYDSSSHYLCSDYAYVTLPDSGGGPLPE
jgi:hypothetical protein